MKWIKTPSYASIKLDEFCCPINPASSYSLLVGSFQRLREKFSDKTKAPLKNHFIPVQKSLSGYRYNYLAKKTIFLTDNGLIKPSDKHHLN